MRWNDSVALVSGGASGLGEATVRLFVERGAKVVAFDMNTDRGNSLASELGTAVVYVQGDVSKEADVGRAVDAAVALGELRIAVNCAGIGIAKKVVGKDGSAHDLPSFQKVIDVNLIGTFNVMRLAGAAMAKNKVQEGERGVIINTASVAAFDGQIGQLAYSASKGAIVGMTLPAARDLAPANIRVLTIAPGTFDTPLLGQVSEEVRQMLAKSIPHPSRLGFPKEYALFAAQIVENPYLNGETIRIDGALRMGYR